MELKKEKPVPTEYFVDKNSIVREIWGKSDTIIFIFAGAAAEFALNKAVDWLYFTGKLPADPLGRLFSTVAYARKIVFLDKQSAVNAINRITGIHAGVEAKRGANIPDWAYRDVLFMLIDYSVRSFELLERRLTVAEKLEVFDVFQRMGIQMGLKGLPDDYDEYTNMRKEHLFNNLEKSHYTNDLFIQYRRHLGIVRYRILLEVQALVAPSIVRNLLVMKDSHLAMFMRLYKKGKKIKIDKLLKTLLLPSEYRDQIKALDKPLV
ncbi:oxygenase MpaB family protein [Flavobacterium sp. NRK1]|uniref:oxygenase MpaB family protein n=1 Tax=Flavobacterium sp. NRK1 TaxID=2954929 RepID=UPI0020924742|nr:oxygenase MpaB family protein [Flavobacterium sp. NRK1]MCO6149687.1 DUF2236 domain-containing protein [Flavobacterium sp. NRK1]